MPEEETTEEETYDAEASDLQNTLYKAQWDQLENNETASAWHPDSINPEGRPPELEGDEDDEEE